MHIYTIYTRESSLGESSNTLPNSTAASAAHQGGVGAQVDYGQGTNGL